MDNAFHRDFSTNAVFATVVNGENAAQTAFRTRSAAGADTLANREGVDSSPPTIPQATDPIRQLTVRSARRIARHAATSAVVPAPAISTTAVPASAVLTTAVPASAVLTTAAQVSADVPTTSLSVTQWRFRLPAVPVTRLI